MSAVQSGALAALATHLAGVATQLQVLAQPIAVPTAASSDYISALEELHRAVVDSMQYLDETIGPCEEGCECILHDLHKGIDAVAAAKGLAPTKAGARDQAVPQPRPTSAPAAPDAVRVLEVLRRLRRPASPGELFAALGLTKYTGRPLVRRLAAEGLVLVTGQTRGTRVHLPKASSRGGPS